jgi:Carboxypeptidase regulatory-like domain
LVGAEQSRVLHSIMAPTRESLPRGIEIVTDAAGRYEAPGVPAGLCEVRAWAAGFAPYSGELEVPARAIAELPIQLAPGAVVKGSVRDPRGAPIEGALVAWGRDHQFAHGITRTNAQGAFQLADLPIGALDLRAEFAGATATTSMQLAAGVTTTWDPMLGSNRPIAGRVVGPRGEGLAALRVAALHEDTEKAAVDTDAEGRFVLAEVGSEPVALELSQSFQTLKRVPSVQPGVNDLVVQLSAAELPTAVLHGRVVDADGRPVAATIMPWRQDSSIALHYRSDPTTAAFRLGPLPAGNYTLSLESPSHGRQPGGTFTLGPDEQRDLGDVVLVTPGEAQLLVTLDGKPAPGGLAFFQLADGSWGDTVVVENGRAHARALRPGRHLVHIDFQGMHGASEVVVQPAATVHANIELQHTTRCEVILDLPPRTKQDQLQATLRAARADGTFAGVFGVVAQDGPPTFFVDLPLGRYRFEIRTADGRTASVPEQELTSLTQTVQRKVALVPGAR